MSSCAQYSQNQLLIGSMHNPAASNSWTNLLEQIVINSCPDGGTPSPENPLTKTKHGNLLSFRKMMKGVVERKKKRQLDAHPSIGQSSPEQEAHLIMTEALLDMLEASNVRTAERVPSEDRFSITNCIDALDEIESIDNQLYFAALDLFENPNFRVTFISHKGNQICLRWLEENVAEVKLQLPQVKLDGVCAAILEA